MSGIDLGPEVGDAFDAMGQFTDTVAGDVRDPYPAFISKRRETPVEVTVNVGFDGEESPVCNVYTYDLVAQVLRDNVTFSSGAVRELMEVVMGPFVLVGMDEPEHKRHRGLVSAAFRHKSLVEWESGVIAPIIEDLIDTFADRGRAELVRDFTFLFPVQIIAELLGVPHEDHEKFHDMAVWVVNVAANPEKGIAASQALREYLADIVEAKRSKPGDDVISLLVQEELDGERLDDEEIYSFLRLLLPAGAETTYRATGSFLFGLLTNPDQLAALRADRSLMGQAVEESIRWESPLLITSRGAAVDTIVGGVEIPAGTMVIPNIGSANHDDTRWDHADEFDILRPVVPHISFGVGPHMCLGMHLARMEMAGAVNALLDRFPNLRLDPEAVDRDDPHIHGERFRSPTAIPVLFD
ncbi:MAG TPA: cytochrome P450 [Acidimicrobiales bacterium]|nr:cytochrome P450 [Acidimicrobiales bacterium]